MRILKIIIASLVLILIAYSGVWYVVTNSIANKINQHISEINLEYSSAKKSTKAGSFAPMRIDFSNVKVASYGFPFTIGFAMKGYSEQWPVAKMNIDYNMPILIGYNLLTQKIFLSYDGDATINFSGNHPDKKRPVNFLNPLELMTLAQDKDYIERQVNQLADKAIPGLNQRISDFKLSIDLPINFDLISILRSSEDKFAIVNMFGPLKVSYDQIAYNAQGSLDKLFAFKNGKGKFSITPRGRYSSLQELIQDKIPSNYHLFFVSKAEAGEFVNNHPLTSLWSAGEYKIDAEFSTAASNINEISKNQANIELSCQLFSKFSTAEIKNLVAKFIPSPTYNNYYSTEFVVDANYDTKAGFIDDIMSPEAVDSFFNILRSNGKIVPEQMQRLEKFVYLLAEKKHKFNLYELDNNKFTIKSDFAINNSLKDMKIKIKNLSVNTPNSGFLLSLDSKYMHNKPAVAKIFPDYEARGVLTLNNYTVFAHFLSTYLYYSQGLYGPIKKLWPAYLKLNESFMRTISDTPNSQSKNLSFSFLFDTKPPYVGKLGSIDFADLKALYAKLIANSGISDFEILLDKEAFKNKLQQELQKKVPQQINNLIDAVEKKSVNEIDKKAVKEELIKIIKDKGFLKKVLNKDPGEGS